MMYRPPLSRIMLYLVVFGLAASVAGLRDGLPSKRFSFQVQQGTGAMRPFEHDWLVAHQRWGRAVPQGSVPSVSDGNDNADDAGGERLVPLSGDVKRSMVAADGRINIQPVGTDELFVANVEIGTPPQLLKLAFDTGSADLWVQSSDTTYRSNRLGPWAAQYQPNASDTSQVVEGSTWSVQYVDGSVASGLVYTDTVRMGNFTVDNSTVQSAQLVASAFEREVGLSGILGLAKSLPNSIQPPATRFLDLLRPQLEAPIFTADLKRNATGRFDFGYIDASLASDEITWLDTIPESPHWDIELDMTTWKSQNGTWWYHKFAATVDTGTTLMFLPNEVVSLYWADVPGARSSSALTNAYTFPCNVTDQLPDLQFKLPGTEHVLTIPGPYLNHSPLVSDPNYCWGALQSAADLQSTILGCAMLRAVFVAFDLQTNRVGFANKVLEWGY